MDGTKVGKFGTHEAQEGSRGGAYREGAPLVSELPLQLLNCLFAASAISRRWTRQPSKSMPGHGRWP